MRGRLRRNVVVAGKWLLIVVLAASGVSALAPGRLGWTNYWGGFVFAPFAIGVAILWAFIELRRPIFELRSR
jgi:hypothetical protein